MRALSDRITSYAQTKVERNIEQQRSTGERKILKREAPSYDKGDIRARVEAMKAKKELEVQERLAKVEAQNEAAKKAEAQAEAQAAKQKSITDLKTKTPKKAEVLQHQSEEKAPKVVNAQGNPIESDVQQNDPNDPNVREKLKDILKTGAFKFNEKEKAALAHILND